MIFYVHFLHDWIFPYRPTSEFKQYVVFKDAAKNKNYSHFELVEEIIEIIVAVCATCSKSCQID